MASRPAFFPLLDAIGVDDTQAFNFLWHPGLAFSQKQKNVRSLHESILARFPGSIPLEISSKSYDDLGVSLSAFNLSIGYNGTQCTVESIFQASKVFEDCGPFPNLYSHDSREVRRFVKANAKGRLIGFQIDNVRWGLTPTRAFYNWLYLHAIAFNHALAERLCHYSCFTDIEFNPKKSLNSQAYAAALYMSFKEAGVLDEALKDKDSFLKYHPADIVALGTGINAKMTEHLEQTTFSF